ncbi:MAG: hypothetical protein AAGK14_01080 [Verrucomicrobiota bacterium]
MAGWLATAPDARANLASQVEGLSGFSGLPADRLTQGEVVSQLLKMGRRQDVGVESLFFVPVAPEAVANRLASWTPTKHPSLGVMIHQGFSPPPTAETFGQLATPPGSAAISLLERETARAVPRFNLSTAEWGLLKEMLGRERGAETVWRFWRQLLNERSNTYFSKGLRAMPAYQTRNGEVKVREVALALIRSQPKLFENFKGLLADAIFAPKSGVQTRAYWELFSVQGFGTLNLGALYFGPGGGGMQVIDFQYYFSSGLYTNMIFYQIWPAELGGQRGSVVWRADLLSSPFFKSSGVNRMGTNMMMQQEVTKTINLQKGDLGP